MKVLTKSIIISTLLILTVLNWSCQKSQAEEDKEIIEKYISDKGLNAVELDKTGLFYVIDKEGGSQHPTSNSEVKVNYVGRLVNGTTFDKADDVSFRLSNVIVGWQIGIPLIGEGGKIKLIIPSRLAYGRRATGDIPKNSVLIFDVDLLLFN
jgi:FKBP-type peptidyl-prolyl cis-trans isomerase